MGTALQTVHSHAASAAMIDQVPVSAGKHLEQIDPSVIDLMQHVFPGTSGVELLDGIRRYAEVKQLTLSIPGSVDVAVVTIPSLAVFAKCLGWGKDKTLRHLATAEALGVLWSERTKNQTAIYFPLSPYQHHPQTTLAELDRLIRCGREKQRQLARGVKERYLLRYGLPPTSSDDPGETYAVLLSVQQYLLQKRHSAAQRHLLLARIVTHMTHLSRAGRATLGDRFTGVSQDLRTSVIQQGDPGVRPHRSHVPRVTQTLAERARIQGDFLHQEGDHAVLAREVGDFGHQEGDPAHIPHQRLGAFLHQEGDLHRETPTREGDFGHQEGDRPFASTYRSGEVVHDEGDLAHAPNHRLLDALHQEGDHPFASTHHVSEVVHNEGDQLPAASPQNGDLRAEEGDFSTARRAEYAEEGDLVHDEGDFSHNSTVGTAVSIIGNISSQDISPKRDVTIIDTATAPYRDPRPTQDICREAKFYEGLFDNPRSRKWTGSLVETVRATPPEIRRVAAVGAIYYSYQPQPNGERVYSPGGWFTAHCKRYSQPGARIPAAVRSWAETDLPLASIAAALQEGYRTPTELALAGTLAQAPPELPEDTVPTDAAEAPEWQTLSSRPREPQAVARPGVRLATWMTRSDAERLRQRILSEGRVYHLAARVVPGERTDTFVTVALWDDGISVVMNNEAEWVDYFREVKACRESDLEERQGSNAEQH